MRLVFKASSCLRGSTGQPCSEVPLRMYDVPKLCFMATADTMRLDLCPGHGMCLKQHHAGDRHAQMSLCTCNAWLACMSARHQDRNCKPGQCCTAGLLLGPPPWVFLQPYLSAIRLPDEAVWMQSAVGSSAGQQIAGHGALRQHGAMPQTNLQGVEGLAPTPQQHCVEAASETDRLQVAADACLSLPVRLHTTPLLCKQTSPRRKSECRWQQRRP